MSIQPLPPDPDLVAQLKIFAALAAFRLQYDRGVRRPGPTGPKVPAKFAHIPKSWRAPLYWVEIDHSAPKVPHEGIVVEPVWAWRCWRWDAEREVLLSCVMRWQWWPGCVMRGDVSEAQGVHAWKTREQAQAYLEQESAGSPISSVQNILVLGRLKMWGEIAEHDDGWRSDAARIVGLEKTSSWEPGLLDRIREIYRVGA